MKIIDNKDSNIVKVTASTTFLKIETILYNKDSNIVKMTAYYIPRDRDYIVR